MRFSTGTPFSVESIKFSPIAKDGNFFDVLRRSFFAPRDTALFPACGMFTLGHIFALLFTLALVVIALILCRNFTREKLRATSKITAIVFTVLELIKIGYNFYYGYTWADAWVPLAFCSLFIYASWLAGFGKGKAEKLGVGFLTGGCPTAGFLFLLFPTTSLQMHPLFHYLCMHSMLFHGAMLFTGLAYILYGEHKLDKKNFVYYAVFCTFFAIVAVILNSTIGCNMMFLREPFNLPLPFIAELQKAAPVLYTLLIFAAYLACYIVSFGISKLAIKAKARKTDLETEAQQV